VSERRGDVEVWHHIAFNILTDPDMLAVVEQHQLDHKRTPGLGAGSVLVSLDISESDPRWQLLRTHIHGALDIARTVFTPKEILAAEWVRLIPVFQKGYPHPKDTWVTRRGNFKAVCGECGIEVQVAPFKIKGEPRMGKHHFMSLIWTYTLFATRAVVQDLVEKGIRGFEPWDVLVAKTGKASEIIQQLHVDAAANPGFVPETVTEVRCPRCETVKYRPHRIGPIGFRKNAFTGIGEDLLLTHEWFGDGKMAFQEILVSHRVAELILGLGLQGVTLQPVRLTEIEP